MKSIPFTPIGPKLISIKIEKLKISLEKNYLDLRRFDRVRESRVRTRNCLVNCIFHFSPKY